VKGCNLRQPNQRREIILKKRETDSREKGWRVVGADHRRKSEVIITSSRGGKYYIVKTGKGTFEREKTLTKPEEKEGCCGRLKVKGWLSKEKTPSNLHGEQGAGREWIGGGER